METFNVYSIEMNPSDDEGLAYIYFNLSNFRYFTICRFVEDSDQKIYIEYSEQTQGIYSNDIRYSLLDNGILFEFEQNIESIIKLKSPICFTFKVMNFNMLKLKDCLETIF